MVELLETLHDAIESGLTWATGLSVVLLILKWREGRMKAKQRQRMEDDIRCIKQHLGVPEWTGNSKKSASADRLNYRHLLYGYCEAILRRIFKFRRRIRAMQINISKAWVAAVIVYFGGKAAEKYGFTFQEEWANQAADFIITWVLPAAAAWLNKHKTGGAISGGINISAGANK